MRSNAARTIQEDANRPASVPVGHNQINVLEFDTAYKAWLKRRGLKETPQWRHNMFGKNTK
jgi:hypothetical protein